jgi:enoyl-[acyl-carrier-protein] reductase (NADH)
MAVDISAYSFVACARAAEPLMETRAAVDGHDDVPGRRARRAALQTSWGVAKATLDASVRYLAWDHSASRTSA